MGDGLPGRLRGVAPTWATGCPAGCAAAPPRRRRARRRRTRRSPDRALAEAEEARCRPSALGPRRCGDVLAALRARDRGRGAGSSRRRGVGGSRRAAARVCERPPPRSDSFHDWCSMSSPTRSGSSRRRRAASAPPAPSPRLPVGEPSRRRRLSISCRRRRRSGTSAHKVGVGAARRVGVGGRAGHHVVGRHGGIWAMARRRWRRWPADNFANLLACTPRPLRCPRRRAIHGGARCQSLCRAPWRHSRIHNAAADPPRR